MRSGSVGTDNRPAAGQGSGNIDSGLLPWGSCCRCKPRSWLPSAQKHLSSVPSFPEGSTLPRIDDIHFLNGTFKAAIHGFDGEQFVPTFFLLSQVVLSDSASHAAAVLWGVTKDFSNEPFLFPAAPLALKPQATSPGSGPE